MKDTGYSEITHLSQTEHSFVIDGLVDVSPLHRGTIGYGATLVLKFDRKYNNALTIHFPFYSVGQTSREKLIVDWQEFLDAATPTTPATITDAALNEWDALSGFDFNTTRNIAKKD